jgi:hypothetical protein
MFSVVHLKCRHFMYDFQRSFSHKLVHSFFLKCRNIIPVPRLLQKGSKPLARIFVCYFVNVYVI